MQDIRITSHDQTPGIGEHRKDQALRKACHEFESIFTYEMLKSMRRTIDKTGLFHGGPGEEIFESLLDQEMAKKMSGGSPNSLAGMLYSQLTGQDRPGAENNNGSGLQGLRGMTPLQPLEARISSAFGWRKDPIHGEERFHNGIDLAAGEGTIVRASLPGRVMRSDHRDNYGNAVLLDHGQGFTTLYAHNETNLVRQGEWVEKGTPLGRVGSTGRSTGPHLHFEVKRNGKHLDPRQFFGSNWDDF